MSLLRIMVRGQLYVGKRKKSKRNDESEDDHNDTMVGSSEDNARNIKLKRRRLPRRSHVSQLPLLPRKRRKSLLKFSQMEGCQGEVQRRRSIMHKTTMISY